MIWVCWSWRTGPSSGDRHRDRFETGCSPRVSGGPTTTPAISGLRIINGGGRAEAQAAHTRPVQANGPDSLWNGVALCSTFHWMFDRGLILIDEDYDSATIRMRSQRQSG